MFGSRARKALVGSADALVKGAYNSATDNLGRPGDRDAVLMACGFAHYALTYYLKNREIAAKDIAPIMTAFAMAVRRHAPNHGLPVSYLDETRVTYMKSMQESGGDAWDWIVRYYANLGELVSVNEGTFLGVLTRETMAVRGER